MGNGPRCGATNRVCVAVSDLANKAGPEVVKLPLFTSGSEFPGVPTVVRVFARVQRYNFLRSHPRALGSPTAVTLVCVLEAARLPQGSAGKDVKPAGSAKVSLTSEF